MLCKVMNTGLKDFHCRLQMKRKHPIVNVEFAGNLKSIDHEH